MSSSTRIKSARFDAAKYGGLDRDALIRIFRMMQMSRRLDDREIQLKRQNKIYFQISGAGHEAISAAAAMVLKPRHDWIYPYYRDRALVLGSASLPWICCCRALAQRPIPLPAVGRCRRTGARPT